MKENRRWFQSIFGKGEVRGKVQDKTWWTEHKHLCSMKVSTKK